MKTTKITQCDSEWLKEDGPQNHIVITSRIRFARNLKGRSFPGWARSSERVEILDELRPLVDGLDEMRGDSFSELMQELSALDKQVLVERHLVSREHAAKGRGSAVAVSENQSVCIMINEEDHLRMQALQAGFQLDAAYRQMCRIDEAFEGKVELAFDPEWGYLTACPTNLGTGLRASVMVHLPALVLGDQIGQVIQAVNKIGLAVRGLYGEGTEAMGNLFQISNQTTLGESEEDIIKRLAKVASTVIKHEQNARDSLSDKRPRMLIDHIGRAYGVLAHAYSMPSKEALNLLSHIRLGIDLGVFDESVRQIVDELIIETQPAHLQKKTSKKLAAEKRDALRAEIIRDRLKSLTSPVKSELAEKSVVTAEEDEPNDE